VAQGFVAVAEVASTFSVEASSAAFAQTANNSPAQDINNERRDKAGESAGIGAGLRCRNDYAVHTGIAEHSGARAFLRLPNVARNPQHVARCGSALLKNLLTLRLHILNRGLEFFVPKTH
jgi:hypothetical protein